MAAQPWRRSGEGLGLDGTGRLRCYVPLADTTWLSTGCGGPRGCQRIVPIGIAEAVRLMGSAEATVGALERRLRCKACGGRDIRIVVAVDPQPAEARKREGLLPEVRAKLGEDKRDET